MIAVLEPWNSNQQSFVLLSGGLSGAELSFGAMRQNHVILGDWLAIAHQCTHPHLTNCRLGCSKTPPPPQCTTNAPPYLPPESKPYLPTYIARPLLSGCPSVHLGNEIWVPQGPSNTHPYRT